MGFETWHDYGYGICLSDILPCNPARLRSFVCSHPSLHQDLLTWLDGRKRVKEMDFQDFEDWGYDIGSAGIASILAKVIEEEEHIVLLSCTDFDGNCYLIYPPAYPWDMHEEDLSITQDEIERIIRKYVSWLTDDEVDFDYQSVGNGG